MPIYAYKCAACGFAKDVLQKMSDPPLAECPSCGQAAFEKQLTAAGFQLKGSGWYVTDFRDGGGKKDKKGKDGNGADGAQPDAAAKPADAAAESKPAADAPAAAAPAAASAKPGSGSDPS